MARGNSRGGRGKDDYDNNMRGVLFRNDDKDSDKDPDYNGQCEVDGEEFWLAAWVNKSQKGEKYLKLSFTEKDEDRGSSRGSSRRSRDDDDDDDRGHSRGRSRRDRDDDDDDDDDRGRGRSRSRGRSRDDEDDDVPF